MGRSDAVIKSCWQEWVESGKFQRYDGSVQPTSTADRDNEIRLQLCPDDHRRRVWRRPGQRADPAFTIARYTVPQPGVLVWGAVSFDSCSALVIITGTHSQTVRRQDDILRTVLLPFHLRYLGLIFQKIRPDHVLL
ncbi:uncharacterized protein TNCV_3000601 [Trichonephila clavipes]|nr:uncharacterized protein TNCV_3000601 [Trichonephila clavipes]